MSEKIKLAFCIHSHQPVGNYPWVFEKGAQDCYMPFLRYLKRYRGIRATLHFSGPLLEWFEANRPGFYELLRELLSRNQIEILGGGFYEPILSVIPAEDARMQVKMCNDFISGKLGVRPTGVWCTERIWDQSIPDKLSGTGIEYTLLDDTPFLAAGLKPEDVHGYFITERHGCPLKVFPIDMKLRYIIPFKEPDEIINYLLSLKDRGVEAVTYGDDGEKFGMWPGTLKWVYEDKWLERFMEALSSNDEIEVVTLSDVIKAHRPRGLVYLPSASYQEMMEWNLFPEQGRLYSQMIHEAKSLWDFDKKRGFLRGGIWDNFLAKYPESNRMHKKMLKISGLARGHDFQSPVKKHLFMSQCNCGYWHGLFGGVYLDILRGAIYENLIRAETLIDKDRLKDRQYIVEKYDHDLDGYDEILVTGRKMNCIFSPEQGASVFGIDFKPSFSCITDVMMRHPEIYHDKIIDSACNEKNAPSDKEKPLSIHDIQFITSDELRKLLIYDTYPKNSFITHILKEKPELSVLLKGVGPGEMMQMLDVFRTEDIVEGPEELRLRFRAVPKGLDVVKEYRYRPSGEISLSHEIKGEMTESMYLAVEMNFMTDGKPRVDTKAAEERIVIPGKSIVFNDLKKDLRIEISSEKTWDIVYLPIECASQSESGFEKTFQGWNIYFIRQLNAPIPELKFILG